MPRFCSAVTGTPGTRPPSGLDPQEPPLFCRLDPSRGCCWVCGSREACGLAWPGSPPVLVGVQSGGAEPHLPDPAAGLALRVAEEQEGGPWCPHAANSSQSCVFPPACTSHHVSTGPVPRVRTQEGEPTSSPTDACAVWTVHLRLIEAPFLPGAWDCVILVELLKLPEPLSLSRKLTDHSSNNATRRIE